VVVVVAVLVVGTWCWQKTIDARFTSQSAAITVGQKLPEVLKVMNGQRGTIAEDQSHLYFFPTQNSVETLQRRVRWLLKLRTTSTSWPPVESR